MRNSKRKTAAGGASELVIHLNLALYLEADILQVVGVPLYDLLDEVWVCGFQVGASWLV